MTDISKKLFKLALLNIKELIRLRSYQIQLLERLHRKHDTFTFKLKNYNIWLSVINKYNYNHLDDITAQDSSEESPIIKTEADIIKLKFTKSLEKHMIELYKAMKDKTIPDKTIPDTIDTLDTPDTPHTPYTFTSSSSNHVQIPVFSDIPPLYEEITLLEKELKDKDKDKDKNGGDDDVGKVGKVGKFDTSTIEAQPKILATEQRPKDKRGGEIFDLRYIYGVGPRNAEKLVDNNVTLEKLLEDWTNWIKKNPTNAILLYSKMPIPPDYTKTEWAKLSEANKRDIQMSILHNKLVKETTHLHKLNSHQLLGIKYFHDISQKIERANVAKAERILTATAIHLNPKLQVTLCGSYRRGLPKSGDVDCLITHPDIATLQDLEQSPQNILAKYVELLTNIGFIIDHLTDFGKSKYMGFCIIQGKKSKTEHTYASRIDIRFIPYNSYGAAILYFTGSKTFNTQMRTHALNKGYSLNEYGLTRLHDKHHDSPDKNPNLLIPCKTEEEVFKILDYPYKKPEDRNI